MITTAKLVEAIIDSVNAETGMRIIVHQKPKGEDGKAQVAELLAIVKQQSFKVGMIGKETEEGNLMAHATRMLKADGLTTVDVSSGIANAMCVKDDAEQRVMNKAAELTSKAMSWLVEYVEEIVNDNQRVSHAKLSEQCEDKILEPEKLGIRDMDADDVDICYPPIIQSGGEYELKMSAQSSEKKLHYSVVHLSVGARHMQYCANVGRTMMIDPSKQMEAVYAAAVAAQEAAISALVDGADLAAPYDAARAVFLGLNPAGKGEELASKLGRSVGSVIGLELREVSITLGPKFRGSVQKVVAGQSFNVQIALADLTNEEAKVGSKAHTWAIMIADTVLISPAGAPPEILTKAVKKKVKDVAYQINEDDDANNVERQTNETKAATVSEGGVVLGAKTRHDPSGLSNEEARRRQQATLADRKNRETHARLVGAQQAVIDGGKGGSTAEFVSYKNVTEIPASRLDNHVIAVDRDAESILLPVHGNLVPYHIMAIKSVSVTQDSGASFIRINFNSPTAPGATAANATYPANIKFPDMCFLREISFRSSDGKHANYIVQEMRALKRMVTQRETEMAERATLVRQERLMLSQGRVHRLVGLWMLPTFSGRGGRKAGTLEAHTNGLRYVGAKADEQVDVIYSNIKFAFFQPAKKEIKTLIHFHLHNPIMVGKKKTKDVQFYMEVMEAVQSLDGGRRNMYDPDEIEEEQRDRDREKRIHKEISGFCRKVQDIWEKDFPQLNIEFDSPYHDLAFDGVPFKSTVRILPTATCLVELTEFPPLVVSAEDMEVINLERVGFHLKNFDMAIVFKDFTKDVHRIDQIPIQNLDNIKQWLATLDIKYYEGKANLNWKPLLRQIKEDPDEWLESGGWEFLNNEIDDDEEIEGEGAESESDFEPSESEEESDFDESGSESLVESEDDDAGDTDNDDEGMEWDELEEEAQAADEDASDSEDMKRKRWSGSKKRI
jgi:nucleosome binding factor SPN SPT16 subunit